MEWILAAAIVGIGWLIWWCGFVIGRMRSHKPCERELEQLQLRHDAALAQIKELDQENARLYGHLNRMQQKGKPK
jgi:hypothetical protein